MANDSRQSRDGVELALNKWMVVLKGDGFPPPSPVECAAFRDGYKSAGSETVRSAERKPGDVFQVNEKHGRAGWIGVFILATEIKPWGIQGFAASLHTHDEKKLAWIRLKWEEIDYIGRAAMVPNDAQGER